MINPPAMGILKAPSSSLLYFIVFLLWLILTSGVQGGIAKDGGFRPRKLFVFGDSYASTGNNDISVRSWKVPYGITFPGVPTGRFSDGRVLTDFLAKYLGLKSPMAYRVRSIGSSKQLNYGMNFATGGAGIFDTIFPGRPNMTTQIDLFQQLIEMKAPSTSSGLNSSLALVALSGNDYSSYLAGNGSFTGSPIYISRVVNQLAANLRRIYDLGVGKVVVSNLPPLGCLPSITVSSAFQKCNSTFDPLIVLHNTILQRALAKLNNETNDAFLLLDVHGSFRFFLLATVGKQIQIPQACSLPHHLCGYVYYCFNLISCIPECQARPGSSRITMSNFIYALSGIFKFENALKPCCLGVNNEFICGSVDATTGNKMYTICSNPKKAFFWDTNHPTHEGWQEVFNILKPSLQQMF
ncbi:hypothetical protein SAY86_014773 [Trapa natans]|uniref:GDSL esterase/lipase n=1 Tax=Trapa natans TaxID=22666 RepID=A0AAN7KIJ5_TRANT|nr:hypothetical protein SAY86_014773 [Trapa natans]